MPVRAINFMTKFILNLEKGDGHNALLQKNYKEWQYDRG